MTSNKLTQLFITYSAVFIIASCAHNKIEPVAMPSTANPAAEVDRLASDVEQARSQGYDVLSPDNFKRAEKNLKEAQERRADEKSGDKILESVGYGRAYLERAQTSVESSQNQLADVIKTREQAIAGGANQFPSELESLDKELKSYTTRIENNKKIDRDNITELQADYLDLELKAIKNTRLSEARNTLESAEKKGAKRLVPNAYQEAKEKLTVAEKAIETDRRNDAVVGQAASVAVTAAQRTLTLVDTATENKKRSPEQIAREIEDRNQKIDQVDALNTAAQAEVDATGKRLAAQGAQLSAIEQQRRELASKEQFNKVFEAARSEFANQEADVYRQGDNMIIRLKSMKFATGRSDLPAESLPVLNKVKNVIGQLPTENIVVEGHTDSTGAADLNKKLSGERASAVANYFTAENAITAENIESIGYGYEKPIASNKNRAGREMNRRVDIVIKPSHASAPAQNPEDPAATE